MSEYIKAKSKMKDRKALVEALIEMGWTKEQIEVCDEPQHLYGYSNDKRKETAHVIIRKKNVGGSSNDIGFFKEEDGTFTPIISAFDRSSGGKHGSHTGGYNDKWLKELNQHYTEKLYTRKAKEKGLEVRKVVGKNPTTGKREVVLTFIN